ncbi:MAG: ferrous iron transport protein A [Planctomycetota bacterium]|nr:MAG: ferrous iron transport protein A [Planctomycetota bacterium]
MGRINSKQEDLGPETSLAELPRHARARVLRVQGNGLAADRLRELGFCPGTEVRMERRAPLGDPVVFRLRGTLLCLRRTEARRIAIQPLDR